MSFNNGDPYNTEEDRARWGHEAEIENSHAKEIQSLNDTIFQMRLQIIGTADIMRKAAEEICRLKKERDQARERADSVLQEWRLNEGEYRDNDDNRYPPLW